MKTRKLLLALVLFAVIALCCSCSDKSGGMKDGYYTAEGENFNEYGWKEYVTIYISDNRILTVEYDAYNPSGFVRSWDLNYMRTMNIISGTYPNKFTREYSVLLLTWQDPDKLDAVSGATESYFTFKQLAEAAIAQARAGDSQVALVGLEG